MHYIYVWEEVWLRDFKCQWDTRHCKVLTDWPEQLLPSHEKNRIENLTATKIIGMKFVDM